MYIIFCMLLAACRCYELTNSFCFVYTYINMRMLGWICVYMKEKKRHEGVEWTRNVKFIGLVYETLLLYIVKSQQVEFMTFCDTHITFQPVHSARLVELALYLMLGTRMLY